MTQSAPRWLRIIAALCSDDLLNHVLAPALADLAYERSTQPMTRSRLLVGYWRIVLAVASALPRDVLMHCQPSTATILCTVVAVAFPGLTPSIGTARFWRPRGPADGRDVSGKIE